MSRLVTVWFLAYLSVRLHWTLTGSTPAFPPLGTDLMVFTGWSSVALCAAAAAVAAGLSLARSWHALLAVAGWCVTAALVLSCPLLLLDVVGLLLPGLGLPFDLGALISRAVCLAGALALARSLVDYRRRWKADCPRCGRTGPAREQVTVQTWAWWAAYAAVAGCLLRLLAQALVGFDMSLFAQGAAAWAFEAGFLLSGVVLPLALVHSWGRTWPGWVPLLAGRRVPRWLLLAPAFAVGAGLTVYFGVGTAQLSVETLTGSWNEDGTDPLPLWFYWLAMPAYLLWGLALLAAAIAHHHRTRPPCPECAPAALRFDTGGVSTY